MKYRQYKFKFYLNASHAINIEGHQGQVHPHTWEITLHTLKISEGFIQFDVLETKIENFLEEYQDKILNEVSPFDVMNPTLENCCKFFAKEIQRILHEEGWILLMIEMSETPTRTFVINMLENESLDTEEEAELAAEDFLKQVKNEKVEM